MKCQRCGCFWFADNSLKCPDCTDEEKSALKKKLAAKRKLAVKRVYRMHTSDGDDILVVANSVPEAIGVLYTDDIVEDDIAVIESLGAVDYMQVDL